MFEIQEKLENTVMKMSLISKHDLDGSLLKQYLNSRVLTRKFTGVGFFTEFLIPDHLIINDISKNFCEIAGKFEDSDITFLFTIFVRNGKLDFLEGFTSHGEWRYDYENIVLF